MKLGNTKINYLDSYRILIATEKYSGQYHVF